MTFPGSETLNPNAELILEDGTSFKGVSFGADVSISGEAVFQTGIEIIFIFIILFLLFEFFCFVLFLVLLLS
jgi:hypothetical protein